MNCTDVEPFLDQLADGSQGSGLPDEAMMRQHVAECASCRAVITSLQQWDRQFVRAMNDVAVPAGLANRIAVALEVSVPAASVPLKLPSRRKSAPRYRVLLGIAAVCLLALSVGWMSLVRESGRLTAASVASLWERSPNVVAPGSNLMKQLPQGWASVQNIAVQDWMQTTISNPTLTVAVKPFQARFQRSAPVEGALYVMPKWRWNSVVASSASRSQVHYASDRVWIAWHEGDAVYLVTLMGAPEFLERLQRQLDSGHVVF